MHSVNKKAFCPLLKKIIDPEVCFDICLVIEGTSPSDELPIGMAVTTDDIRQCLKCDNHVE